MEQIITQYQAVYYKLYNRNPKGLYPLDDEFVFVNDTRIHVNDLAQLVDQLEAEYRLTVKPRRNSLLRLVDWIRQS